MKMINITAVLMLFTSAALFANQNSFVLDQEHHFVIEAPTGGPGPLCWPGIGCPSAVQKGGGGPMCIPGIGCPPGAARGGGGPVCIPDIGCWPGLMP